MPRGEEEEEEEHEFSFSDSGKLYEEYNELAPRAGAGVRDALRSTGGAGGGAPDRREEGARGGPHGFPVQPRRWRHQDPLADHPPHEGQPRLRRLGLPPRLRRRPHRRQSHVLSRDPGD
ncbi:unnamed protein product [Musa hybrid cultivar]